MIQQDPNTAWADWENQSTRDVQDAEYLGLNPDEYHEPDVCEVFEQGWKGLEL